jgi:hypothetical protein
MEPQLLFAVLFLGLMSMVEFGLRLRQVSRGIAEDRHLGARPTREGSITGGERGSAIMGTTGTVVVDRDDYKICDLKGNKTNEFKAACLRCRGASGVMKYK